MGRRRDDDRGRRHHGKKKQAADKDGTDGGRKGGRRGKKRSSGFVDDMHELSLNLSLIELALKQLPKDGNCFFRAVADQLLPTASYAEAAEGQEPYKKVRCMVAKYLKEHKETYEGFIDEEVTLEEYCRRLTECRLWGGHLEMQIVSILFEVNVLIHRAASQTWALENFPADTHKCIQLAYHNGEHYNSVRFADDIDNPPPARTVTLKELRALQARLEISEALSLRTRTGDAKGEVKRTDESEGSRYEDRENFLDSASSDPPAMESLSAAEAGAKKTASSPPLPTSPPPTPALSTTSSSASRESAAESSGVPACDRVDLFRNENVLPAASFALASSADCSSSSLKPSEDTDGKDSAATTSDAPVSSVTTTAADHHQSEQARRPLKGRAASRFSKAAAAKLRRLKKSGRGLSSTS